MKRILAVLILCLMVTPVLASTIASKPTLELGMQRQEASFMGISDTSDFYQIGLEYPVTKNSHVAGRFLMGDNGGISVRTYQLLYRFEL